MVNARCFLKFFLFYQTLESRLEEILTHKLGPITFFEYSLISLEKFTRTFINVAELNLHVYATLYLKAVKGSKSENEILN